MRIREIERVFPALQTYEGDGMPVRRTFPTRALDHVDPFLLLDHFGPMNVKPGEGRGVPPHPHRGFQTVTYMLSGEFEHEDSSGSHGLLGPGDLQWMIAGNGVVHSEMPSKRFQRQGGVAEGFQLWVNLPARDKRISPKYQDIAAERIPVVEPKPGCAIRVLAGSYENKEGLVETRVPVLYLHLKMDAWVSLEIPIAINWNTMSYVFRGSLRTPSVDLHPDTLVHYRNDGDTVEIAAGADGGEFLLMAGEPLSEPMVRYGPFVMNTESEIQEAISDYRAGRLV